MRTIIIGDVHGCLDELQALVRRCGGVPGETQVALVGDLVAKGPDSAGVVRWARESGARAVLGNHDAHALSLRDAATGVAPMPATAKAKHVAVAETLSAADWDWLAALPLSLPLPHQHLVVHGGLMPGVPLAAQKREHLLNLRSITADGLPSSKQEGDPWGARWTGPEHVVFGHDAVRGLQIHPHATGLDTGCVYGGALTALVLPEGELVSVRAKRAYAPFKK